MRMTSDFRYSSTLLSLTLAALFAVSACSEDAPAAPSDSGIIALDASERPDATNAPDATTPDTGPRDAAAEDAMSFPDATIFADASAPDTGAPDAGELDAGNPIDAGPSCDDIGAACRGTCESQYECVDPPGACVPRGFLTCGGFVQQQCPGALVCNYFAGADYGPCFTRAEQACVCAQPNASQRFQFCP